MKHTGCETRWCIRVVSNAVINDAELGENRHLFPLSPRIVNEKMGCPVLYILYPASTQPCITKPSEHGSAGPSGIDAVSYTHLTLPTKRIV